MLFVGCTTNSGVVSSPDGGGSVGPADSGSPEYDAGGPPPADAGTDAGPPDAGTPPDGGTTVQFGGPGPWPMSNVTYGGAQGIGETDVVGMSTDEAQNLWVATRSALYVMRPGDTKFTRFDGNTGSPDVPNQHGEALTYVGNRLHLASNPVTYCDNSFSNPSNLQPPPDEACPITGAADAAGISEIAGGGPNEVFVGYYGSDCSDSDPRCPSDWASKEGTWADPYRHSGQIDRVRLQPDGSIEVVRFNMVSTDNVMFWHNRTVERLIYDHFIHPHELYAGTNHGVDKFTPDNWHQPTGWFASAANNDQWMSDHLHAQVCYHATCVDDSNQRLGDWRGLAIATNGDLWTAGRWAAGEIRWVADNSIWWTTPRADDRKNAFEEAFGDGYLGGCSGNRPVFCPPQEGDYVNLTAVAVTRDASGQDQVWFSSGIIYNDPTDVNYGVARFLANPGPGQQKWTYYDPVRDIGMAEANVRDMIALPDGRLVLAGPNTGLVVWTPGAGPGKPMRASNGYLPDDNVHRLELDAMVTPPALHVSTNNGATTIRVFP
ncbi:MAG TPA: WD40 repeat domain-containing protein [Myxococcales bacterium]|nr:WD40 repeat domain-containing protein [Myxococcales bacterium]